MKARLSSFVGLCFVILLSLVLALSAVAQDKAPKAAKSENIQGNVKEIKNGASTIIVDTGTAPRQVMYSATTKFMVGHSDDNKAGSLAKVQVGNYISCAGAMEKGVLMASNCIYRDKK